MDNIILVRRTHNAVTNIYGPFTDLEEAWAYADKVKVSIIDKDLGISRWVLSQTEFYISRLQK